MSKFLVLGGARSGKSSFAETLVKDQYAQTPDSRLHYVATAVAFDDEMKLRIKEHQSRRDSCWIEHECPTDLSELLSELGTNDIVLIDCLTVWLNNVIYNDGNDITQQNISDKIEELQQVISKSPASFVFVSNEVGMGVVPLGKVTRLFVDNAGWMNQGIASIVDNVVLVTAGIPMAIKGQL
ncbi:bifunctional adenosylcobinamide kinase/adenosylcobinamide-phosphate guanylyltransferase [Vibrio sp.]|nr:bifunctional adenosylcobinamide kinase/adenosylcobinamide-phosphate guanylyltransferase [Vibrio sp.]